MMFEFCLILILCTSFNISIGKEELYKTTEILPKTNIKVCVANIIRKHLVPFKPILILNYVRDGKWLHVLNTLHSEHNSTFIIFNLNHKISRDIHSVSKIHMSYLLYLNNSDEIEQSVRMIKWLSILSPVSKILIILKNSTSLSYNVTFCIEQIHKILYDESTCSVLFLAEINHKIQLWYQGSLTARNCGVVFSDIASLDICHDERYQWNNFTFEISSNQNQRPLRVTTLVNAPFVSKQQNGIEIALLELLTQKLNLNMTLHDQFLFRGSRTGLYSKVFSELMAKYDFFI